MKNITPYFRPLCPGDGVDSPVLGHHAVLLTLSVHHPQQSGLLTKWIPTEIHF